MKQVMMQLPMVESAVTQADKIAIYQQTLTVFLG